MTENQLKELIDGYAEWPDDYGSDYVVCPICGGEGKLNANGKPSKRHPPTHTKKCLRFLYEQEKVNNGNPEEGPHVGPRENSPEANQ